MGLISVTLLVAKKYVSASEVDKMKKNPTDFGISFFSIFMNISKRERAALDTQCNLILPVTNQVWASREKFEKQEPKISSNFNTPNFKNPN
jgi:hypothetical protein